MIEIEGRVLAGLDEFMLRAGHLLLLCRIAQDVGGSWSRIHREAAEKLSQTVVVEFERNREVAEYLAAKGLCRHADSAAAEPASFYYPDLEVYTDSSGALAVRTSERDQPIGITWQDRNLAAVRVRSRVGAITWSAKSGSKTGLSHVCDWAQFLELIDSAGQLSPIGRLLVTITQIDRMPYERWNPYQLGPERLIVAYQYFQRDVDLFARFAPLLLRAEVPLSKASSRVLFVEALQACVNDADASKGVPSHRMFELAQQIRDLERSARKARRDIGETSTAWHRTASRVELYTDLGLLEKNRRDPADAYKYVYFPTEQLAEAAKDLEATESGDDWIERHLVAAILGDGGNGGGEPTSLSDRELAAGLRRIVEGMKLPTTQFPIDCLMLGLACLNADAPSPPSLQNIRQMIEAMPGRYPQVARLARGREGIRAEYLSLNVRNLAEL
jgi:hypothetical protein